MNEQPSRNRTLTCTPAERQEYARQLLRLGEEEAATAPLAWESIDNRVLHGDAFAACPLLPRGFADLLILDPPYNLSKDYHGNLFREKEKSAYQSWFERLIGLLKPLLAPGASVYVCADWKTSLLVAPVLEAHFYLRNRITWEREKGRGAKANWKNNTEDIWFCTMGKDYYFDVDAVKLKRKVIAPYRENGRPKDWQEEAGGNFRLTHPSNIWTDVTVPFWSMPENTDHPTQKPEKLLAKLILASSRAGNVVFDPFLGSGTTAVVAQKLGRRFFGIEQNGEYGCWALKRLARAAEDASIQGYTDGVFWERNTLQSQLKSKKGNTHSQTQNSLFK